MKTEKKPEVLEIISDYLGDYVNVNNKDALYVTEKEKECMLKYCEIDLIENVIEQFSHFGEIVVREEGERPSRFWVVSYFINNHTFIDRQKLAVILSFAAANAGIVQINEHFAMGDMPVLFMLKKLNLITEDDYYYFVDSFFFLSQGNGVKFKL